MNKTLILLYICLTLVACNIVTEREDEILISKSLCRLDCNNPCGTDETVESCNATSPCPPESNPNLQFHAVCVPR